MPLFLIGPRGSGKTSVARILAESLGVPFVDADVLLEQRAGTTIREIFATAGEGAFRDLESALLQEMADLRAVIATGGGVVLRPENRQTLRASGSVVWLTADVDTLYRRIHGDATTAERRPNLYSGGRAEVERIVSEREPLYRECANLQVDTGKLSPEAIVARILAWLPEGHPLECSHRL